MPVRLAGSFAAPADPKGLVLVAVRSGAERRDPLRVQLADFLYHFGFGSLLASLEVAGDPVEGEDGAPDLGRLAGRVGDAVDWLAGRGGPVVVLALEGAVAPALVAAAHLGDRIAALVGSGGRPDRAGSALSRVAAPTLLVAGALGSVEAARSALRILPDTAELAIVDDTGEPGADPESAGTVCWLAQRWFVGHLTRPIS